MVNESHIGPCRLVHMTQSVFNNYTVLRAGGSNLTVVRPFPKMGGPGSPGKFWKNAACWIMSFFSLKTLAQVKQKTHSEDSSKCNHLHWSSQLPLELSSLNWLSLTK